MAELMVGSLNVDGLRNGQKRSSLFKFFKDSIYDVILLQETHVNCSDIADWEREWSLDSFWNPGPSNLSCGVGILFNKHRQIQVLSTDSDTEGRILKVTVRFDNQIFQIVNIYAPVYQQFRETFFLSLNEFLEPNVHTILAGDFNMVEDPCLDRVGDTILPQHTKGIIALDSLKQSFALTDPWREQNPSLKRFSWNSRHSQSKRKSRIDRFYSTKTLSTSSFDFIYNIWTDHCLITMSLKSPTKFERGANYWKLNTSLLDDPAYKTYMNKFLIAAKQNTTRYDSLESWWDMTKVFIQSKTQTFARWKNKERQNAIEQKKREIHKESLRVPIAKNKIEKLTFELKDMQVLRKRGVLIRSREQIILNEDKPSRYFYAQEDIKQGKKFIDKLQVTRDQTLHMISEPQEILKEIHSYYKDLYSKIDTDSDVQQHFFSLVEKKVSEQEKLKLEAPITEADLFLTMKQMEENKSPGLDGLPIEFYFTFWEELKSVLVELANRIYIDQVELPTSHLRGVISLLHKKDSRENLENWRPITLLCADYKLITKTLATRLRSTLSQIIDPDQTCAVPGRDIVSNLCLVRDLIDYTNYKQNNLFIVSYDFAKAFDSLDHEFLQKTLSVYGYGQNFISFIKRTYSNRKAMVMNNGYFTWQIAIERGIIQGDPLSLPLFCIAAEIQANFIRKNKNVTGMHIPGCLRPVKLSLYADDTESISSYSRDVVLTMQNIVTFGKASGCRLNHTKTKGLMILNKTSKQLFQHLKDQVPQISWNEDVGLKVLGIHFFADPLQTENYNWTKAIGKLKKKFEVLKKRNLSLKGKVVLLNTVALSKIWFISNVLRLPQWAFKEIEALIFDFLWDTTGSELLKRQTLYLALNNGGLGILNPKFQTFSIHMKHFFKVVDPYRTDLWLYLARYWLARRIGRLNPPHWQFLNNNSTAKYNGTDPPPTYKEFLRLLAIYFDACSRVTVKSTKSFYGAIFSLHYRGYSVDVERVWDTTFAMSLPWKKLWLLNYNSYLVGKPQDVFFKLMHNCLPTKARLARHSKNKTKPFCKYCKKSENTLHVFARCPIATSIWQTYQPIYEKLIPDSPFRYEKHVLGIPLIQQARDPLLVKLLNTLTQIIVSQLWYSRNCFEKENKPPNIERIIVSINATFQQILNSHFHSLLSQGRLDIFQAKFAISNAICKVENEEIIFSLPGTQNS